MDLIKSKADQINKHSESNNVMILVDQQNSQKQISSFQNSASQNSNAIDGQVLKEPQPIKAKVLMNKQIKIKENQQFVQAEISSTSFDQAVNNIKEFGLHIKNNFKKIQLEIQVQFKDSNGRLNLSSGLLKLANITPFISQLKIVILGNTSKEQWKRIIESLKQFPLLYSLEFNFYQSNIDDSIAEGISEQLSKLQTLHILKISVHMDDFISRKISRVGIANLNSAAYQLNSLEIYEFPFRQERKIQGILPISNFVYYRPSNSYRYALKSFQPYMVEDYKIFKQQIEANAQSITKVVFYEYLAHRYHTDFITLQSQEYNQKLELLTELPYLTSFSSNIVSHFQKQNQKQLRNLENLISQRLTCLCQIISFYKYLSLPLQINPIMVFTDLWII